MIYTIKAHETRYAGVLFRSRLEARWAAFFDLCQWKWEYEPLDLHGWVPDFMLRGVSDIFVEVKPVTEFATKDGDLEKNPLPGVVEKIERAVLQTDCEPLIVGACLFDNKSTHSAQCVGIVGETGYVEEYENGKITNNKKSLWWQWAPFVYDDALDFTVDYGVYWYRISGGRHGGHPLTVSDPSEASSIKALWHEAGNRTRWKPRRSARPARRF